MADFYQHAQLPTLQHLSTPDGPTRESELCELTRARPVALLLPALNTEVTRPALPSILRQVSQVSYISRVVLSMNGFSNEAEMRSAAVKCREWVGEKPLQVLWNDGPTLEPLHLKIGGTNSQGKGANIWMGIAALRASGHEGIVISHDTDIMNYGASLLAKLCYPIAHPRLGYRFSKGYYSRIADRLYGRVTRLLIFPLIRAFQEVLDTQPLLDHLEAFRYPLSGEFAADISCLAKFSIPSAWGLEIAMLCEVHRHLQRHEMCQVDLGFHYEHRHRQLDAGAIEPGLVTAASDVARCLTFQILRESGERSAALLLKKVIEHYQVKALEWMSRYEHVALINGLTYDRQEEGMAVAAFTEALHVLQRTVEQSGTYCMSLRPTPDSLLLDNENLGREILSSILETNG